MLRQLLGLLDGLEVPAPHLPPGSGVKAVEQMVADMGHMLRRSDMFHEAVADLTAEGVQGCVKDAAGVADCKSQATLLFKSGKYSQAAEKYTEVISLQPSCSVSSRLELSKLYCNRALCHLRKEPPHPEAAQADANTAIHSDPSWHKSYYRRATARMLLGDMEGAERDCQLALSHMGSEGGAAVAEVAALLEKLSQAGSSAHSSKVEAVLEGGEKETNQVPDQVWKREPQGDDRLSLRVQEATQGAVEVGFSEQEGRYLTAAQDIPAGTDIFEEWPAASILSKKHRRDGNRCMYCCQRIPPSRGIPCGGCPMAMYCSLQCRSSDTFHKEGDLECGVPWTRVLPDEAVLAARLALISSRDNDFGTEQWRKDFLGSLLSLEDQVLDASLMKYWSLLSHVASSCINSRCQVIRKDVRPSASAQLPISAHLVFLYLCRIAVNGVAMRPSRSHSEADRYGLAVYCMTSLMNHSCQAPVLLRFKGCQLIARCSTAVPRGRSLCISYGPQVGQMSRAVRQQQLKRQYHFECCCIACKPGGDEPAICESPTGLEGSCSDFRPASMAQVNDSSTSLTSDWGYGLKCLDCQKGVVVPTDAEVRRLSGTEMEDEAEFEGGALNGTKAIRLGCCSTCSQVMLPGEQENAAVQIRKAEEMLARAEDHLSQLPPALNLHHTFEMGLECCEIGDEGPSGVPCENHFHQTVNRLDARLAAQAISCFRLAADLAVQAAVLLQKSLSPSNRRLAHACHCAGRYSLFLATLLGHPGLLGVKDGNHLPDSTHPHPSSCTDCAGNLRLGTSSSPSMRHQEACRWATTAAGMYRRSVQILVLLHHTSDVPQVAYEQLELSASLASVSHLAGSFRNDSCPSIFGSCDELNPGWDSSKQSDVGLSGELAERMMADEARHVRLAALCILKACWGHDCGAAH